ncbi:uncharacterized protein BP01DRAFT_367247 [Aspergillus saccharolyticus JOP 1030-1]|uniref:Ankyrin n=1 Tax=Aspergillus saccharolyticus JOP 1030-1 TaxID=1450539 RepID=A0A318ZAU7_9EURO|nr:hypothetical protein BP01DRAFT_367247 [Aspergillus saccharolyticus JOP 1030-1]PYH43454.1 hypothetical protein BP01DRAFT_367247 [Aspergillus saccharolyticus JOP 1030-1]
MDDNLDRPMWAEWCPRCIHQGAPKDLVIKFNQLSRRASPPLDPDNIQCIDGSNFLPAVESLWSKKGHGFDQLERILRPDTQGTDPATGPRTLKHTVQRRFQAIFLDSIQDHRLANNGRMFEFYCTCGAPQAPVPIANHRIYPFPNALHWALAKDSADQIRLAITCGLQSKTPVFYGYTLLGAAILAKAHNVIRYLFSHYRWRYPETADRYLMAQVNWVGRNCYKSPLELALVIRDKPTVWLLLELYGHGNPLVMRAPLLVQLCNSSATGVASSLNWLIKKIGVDLLGSNRQPNELPVQLTMAPEDNPLQGTDPAVYLLRQAITNGHWEPEHCSKLLSILLEQLRLNRDPAARLALLNDNLLDPYTAQNQPPPLAWCLKVENMPAFSELVREEGMDLDRPFVIFEGSRLYTLLSYAVSKDQPTAVDMLLQYGCNTEPRGPVSYHARNPPYPSPWKELVDMVIERTNDPHPAGGIVGLDQAFNESGSMFRKMTSRLIPHVDPRVFVTGIYEFPEWIDLVKDLISGPQIRAVRQMLDDHGY